MALAVVAGLAFASLPATRAPAAFAGGASDVGSSRASSAVRHLLAGRPPAAAAPMHAALGASRALESAAASPASSSVSLSDPKGDSQSYKADIGEIGATLTGGSVRLTATLPTGADPRTDAGWLHGETGLIWYLDTGGDGSFERAGVLLAVDPGRLAGYVVKDSASAGFLCSANATYDAHRFSIMVPTRCLGNPKRLAVAVAMDYDESPIRAGADGVTDVAPDLGFMGPVTRATTAARVSGGFVLDARGALHAATIGGSPKGPTGLPTPGAAPVRGLAATPDGAHAYTLDGSGVLRGFAFGRNDVAPRAYGTTTWPGQDVARGVAIGPEGSSGLVVDRYGGLHPFGIGTNRTAPKVLGAPTWPGVDMARGVAMMPDGSGGFELDAFGGLHWFSLGTASPAPRLFGVPSFPHDDAARGLALFPDGSGGFEVDKAGNFAWFSIGTRRTQPPMTGSATWPGTDTARGLILLTSLLAWPAPVAKTLVPVSGTITDVVVDAAGAFAYATTQGPDRLAVVDLASRTLVASITVGSSPSGLDLTPDGTKLYVTNKGGGISVVSVGARQVQRTIAVPHGTEFPELAVFPASIAIAANGTALVSTISSPGSGGPLYQLDLATDTFTDRSDHTRAMTDEMILKPSGDRTRLVFAIGGTSGGTVGVYSTSTDTFFFRGWDRFIDYATLNHDGSRVLVDGRSVCDTSSTRACDLVGGSHIKTGVLAATGPLGYRPEGTTLQTFDSDALRVLANHELGDTVTGFWSARTAVSPDSRTAVVVTDHGLAVIDLTI